MPDVVDVTVMEIEQLLLAGRVAPLSLIEVAAGAALKVPPHRLVTLGEFVTCIPAGNESLTPTPVSATVFTDGLANVRVRVEVPLTGMLVGENDLVIVGGAMMARPAEAVVPVPPFDELTVPVVLVMLPAVFAVTSTFTSQLMPTGIDPPVRLIELVPALAVKVPPQVLLVFGTVATTMPDGNVSLTATPLSGRTLAAGLVMVSISVEVPPWGMLFGVNDFVMVGGASADNVSEPVLPMPPFVDVTLPVVLVKAPPAVAVTFTVMVQNMPALTEPPLRLMTPDPTVALVNDPPQPLFTLSGLAT